MKPTRIAYLIFFSYCVVNTSCIGFISERPILWIENEFILKNNDGLSLLDIPITSFGDVKSDDKSSKNNRCISLHTINPRGYDMGVCKYENAISVFSGFIIPSDMKKPYQTEDILEKKCYGIDSKHVDLYISFVNHMESILNKEKISYVKLKPRIQ